jgi:hypothetical protein
LRALGDVEGRSDGTPNEDLIRRGYDAFAKGDMEQPQAPLSGPVRTGVRFALRQTPADWCQQVTLTGLPTFRSRGRAPVSRSGHTASNRASGAGQAPGPSR